MTRLRALLAALAAAAWLCPAVPAFADDDACLACHGNKDAGAPAVRTAAFQKSVHKDIGCASCHEDKKAVPHGKKGRSVSCEGCHAKAAETVGKSDHGKRLIKGGARSGAHLCLSCHSAPHELKPVKDPASSVSKPNIPATCNRCHQKLHFQEKFGIDPLASYARTVHGKALLVSRKGAAAGCTDCHGGHDLNFARNSASRAFRLNVPRTCGRCHAQALQAYERSVHGRKALAGVKEAPVCTDCHGEHTIAAHREPGSSVFTGSVVKTCSACHGSEKLIAKFGMPLDPTKAYRDSYHGVAFTAGNLSSANCASCHRHHDILPPSDPLSSVSPANLHKTCGACHSRAGELVSLGKVHRASNAKPDNTQDLILKLVRQFYVLMILGTIGGMLAHNALDHKRKLFLGPAHPHDPHAVRLSLNERIQHLFLFVSFIGLAYTGFCHTYPESLWARAVFRGAWGATSRSLLHRVFAGVFMALGAYHAFWLAATREGRGEFLAMFPRWRDFLDFLDLQRYNLLHRGKPPKFDRFNYMEKAEYWALVWGSFVMVATGCVVWLRNTSLHYLPKWIIDLCLLVHFMEAILACLAIAVWHLYWTVFDQDVYPMNWAWITGKVRLERDGQGTEDESHDPA